MLLLLLCLCVGSTRGAVAPLEQQLDAVKALAKRVLPAGVDAAFEWELTPLADAKETFTIGPASEHTDATVLLGGSGGVALASALNWSVVGEHSGGDSPSATVQLSGAS